MLFTVGFAGMVTVGVAASTSGHLKLWPNPWFIASLAATIVGVPLIAWAWLGLKRGVDSVPVTTGSVGVSRQLVVVSGDGARDVRRLDHLGLLARPVGWLGPYSPVRGMRTSSHVPG